MIKKSKLRIHQQNPSKKIRKGDKVIALAGNYRGMTGTVLSCNGEQVIVQGLNVRKRHMPKQAMNQPGRIVEMEKPIHISNLRVCTEQGEPLKLQTRNNNGNKELYYNKDGQEIVYRSVKTITKS